MFGDCLLCVSLALPTSPPELSAGISASTEPFLPYRGGLRALSLSAPMVPFPEIVMYQRIPQYHKAYSSHYEFATEVNNSKLISDGGVVERGKGGGKTAGLNYWSSDSLP